MTARRTTMMGFVRERLKLINRDSLGVSTTVKATRQPASLLMIASTGSTERSGLTWLSHTRGSEG